MTQPTSVTAIPLNTQGKTINVHGFMLTVSMWHRVVSCAWALYDNGIFMDDDEFNDLDNKEEIKEEKEEKEYRVSEICEALRAMSNKQSFLKSQEGSMYDQQIDTLYALYDDNAIQMIVEFGESKDWNLKA
jgi:hypothetical protein